MKFVGIDPGKAGFAAVIQEDGTVRSAPFSEHGYAILFESLLNERTFAILERVHSSPQMGVTSSFSFGQNFGFIQGLLTANRISYELVLPNKWKRFFGCTADKNTSIAVAQRLFPDVDLRATDRCRKPHDGKAEALLMAEYGRRMYGKGMYRV